MKIVPWGMRKLLVFIKENYNNPPLYVTENGCSDSGETLHDEQRVKFYTNYLNEVLKGNGCWPQKYGSDYLQCCVIPTRTSSYVTARGVPPLRCSLSAGYP